jgi:hypothetical protein
VTWISLSCAGAEALDEVEASAVAAVASDVSANTGVLAAIKTRATAQTAAGALERIAIEITPQKLK